VLAPTSLTELQDAIRRHSCVLAELTFKVFPAFRTRISLQVDCTDCHQATERLIEAASSRWELLALDYHPAQKRLLLQLGGTQRALEQIAADIESRWPGDVQPIESCTADTCWETIRTLGLDLTESKQAPTRPKQASQTIVAQVALTPTVVPELEQKLGLMEGVDSHYSVGGNVATLTCQQPENVLPVSELLTELQLVGLVLQGRDTPLWLGNVTQRAIDRAIKTALDPQRRFPSCDPANLQADYVARH
jgi:hypothetical protein